MICSSGIGFNPVVADVLYTFDVSGLYNGLFVMSDRQTGSVWTHYDGAVLTGPLANEDVRLTFAPLIHTTWAEWTALHPETTVLDWYAEFADRYRTVQPGASGLGPGFQRTLLNWDNRLPENELVLGVGVGDSFRAYRLADFAGGLTAVQETIAGLQIVALLDAENSFGLAFLANLDGVPVQITAENGVIRDDLGNEYDLTGEVVRGPNAGAQLPFVTSFVSEWYGWAAYHPATTIYGE